MDFEAAILAVILTAPGGARFPTPVELIRGGEPTGTAAALGLVADGRLVLDAEQRVHSALRALLLKGKLKLHEKWGYTWLVAGEGTPVTNFEGVARLVGYTLWQEVWS